MKKILFTKGLVITLSAGLYAFVFLFLYAIPCFLDPTDCSGRDIGVFMLAYPTSDVLLQSATNVFPSAFEDVRHQMIGIFFAGMLQYALAGYLIVLIVGFFRKKGK